MSTLFTTTIYPHFDRRRRDAFIADVLTRFDFFHLQAGGMYRLSVMRLQPDAGPDAIATLIEFVDDHLGGAVQGSVVTTAGIRQDPLPTADPAAWYKFLGVEPPPAAPKTIAEALAGLRKRNVVLERKVTFGDGSSVWCQLDGEQARVWVSADAYGPAKWGEWDAPHVLDLKEGPFRMVSFEDRDKSPEERGPLT